MIPGSAVTLAPPAVHDYSCQAAGAGAPGPLGADVGVFFFEHLSEPNPRSFRRLTVTWRKREIGGSRVPSIHLVFLFFIFLCFLQRCSTSLSLSLCSGTAGATCSTSSCGSRSFRRSVVLVGRDVSRVTSRVTSDRRPGAGSKVQSFGLRSTGLDEDLLHRAG